MLRLRNQEESRSAVTVSAGGATTWTNHVEVPAAPASQRSTALMIKVTPPPVAADDGGVGGKGGGNGGGSGGGIKFVQDFVFSNDERLDVGDERKLMPVPHDDDDVQDVRSSPGDVSANCNVRLVSNVVGSD